VVADGARAQKPGLLFEAETRGCLPRNLEIRQQRHILSIKEWEPRKDTEASTYHETGYPTQEQFWEAVARVLPEYYRCGHVRITFTRDGCYPNRDFFTVAVDAEGRVTEISKVYWDE